MTRNVILTYRPKCYPATPEKKAHLETFYLKISTTPSAVFTWDDVAETCTIEVNDEDRTHNLEKILAALKTATATSCFTQVID